MLYLIIGHDDGDSAFLEACIILLQDFMTYHRLLFTLAEVGAPHLSEALYFEFRFSHTLLTPQHKEIPSVLSQDSSRCYLRIYDIV
jgi:hypothetical protein